MSKPYITPILVLILVIASMAAHADTVVLNNGRTLSGTIVKETSDAVTIQVTNLGTMTVEKSRIKEIQRAGAARRPTPRRPGPPAQRPIPLSRPAPLCPSLPAPSARGPAQGILTAFVNGLPEGDEVSTQVVWKCLHELEPLGRRATGDLVHALLTSRDWRIRLLAVRALKPLADPSAIPALIHALADPFHGGIVMAGMDPTAQSGYKIRQEAKKALKSIGQKAHMVLLAMAADRRHPDQWAAVEGLRQLDVPNRVPVLVRLARDFAQKKKVRNSAVTGLCDQGNGAQEALARLLPDKVVQKEVAAILKRSKARAAIDVLMSFVRKAGTDTDLAGRAAELIFWIDGDYRPRLTNDRVDLLLFFNRHDLIHKELGAKALPRLNSWLSSRNSDMRSAARKALTRYGNIRVGGGSNTKRPSPPPTRRPPSTGSS